jgi:hypothetical protein
MTLSTHSLPGMKKLLADGHVLPTSLIMSVLPANLPAFLRNQDNLPCRLLHCVAHDDRSAKKTLFAFVAKYQNLVDATLAAGHDVHVHCHSGVSRSKTAAVLFTWMNKANPYIDKHLDEICALVAENAHDKQCVPMEWAREYLQQLELARFGTCFATFPWFAGDEAKIRRCKSAFLRGSVATVVAKGVVKEVARLEAAGGGGAGAGAGGGARKRARAQVECALMQVECALAKRVAKRVAKRARSVE